MSKNLPALIISGITISQDAEGRFSLNDLHKAAGGESRHEPWRFLDLDATKGLIDAISNSLEMVNKNPVSIRVDRYGGSSVVKELVYRYAMWVSPAFELKVIRAYDALATGASSIGVSVEQLLEQALPVLLKESESRMMQQLSIAIAANRDEFDVRLREVIAGGGVSMRRGKTAGVLWKEHGLPPLNGAAPWFSNRLCELNCQVEGGGCSESGATKAKLFDPDKVAAAMKGGLKGVCKQYVQQRGGQAHLFPRSA